ncbi:MAG: pyruvate, phosphate dikinase [Phycisphaerae bacterium]|nr:pyruvate, phosphate dikinase [Phycisphaerae bacterium]
MAKMTKWVYSWGNGKAEGKGTQKQLLGGKGAGLAEMTSIGLPVPAGFTITTECCSHYFQGNKRWPNGLEKQIKSGLKKLESVCKKKLGDPKDPLLVSVRSGAAVSMPGMMETILNLGLTDVSLEGLAELSGNRRFALDAYRRLIMMYGSTAMGIDRAKFDDAFEQEKNHQTRFRIGKQAGEKVLDTEVNESELEQVIERFKDIYRAEVGAEFPQDPYEQLVGAISAVFESWMAEKAITYRKVENITGLPGTAVNVCQMVFGNMGDDSGTGVCFTRDPSTGENQFYGDLLMNAQGEDVVAGVRTPIRLGELENLMPELYAQLEAVRAILELHYRDMQDLEFTFERDKLYMLQCRTGKRSPEATFKIAVDQATKPLLDKREIAVLVKQKYLPKKYAALAGKPIISKAEAVARIAPEDVERLFYLVIDPSIGEIELEARKIGEGINAVPGAACGKVVFSAAAAEAQAAQGEKVILVRKETSPEDVGGMHASVGILTATGGKTSHAAVVARGWGRCCIVGCKKLEVDEAGGSLTLGDITIREGEALTLDGSAGRVFQGEMPLVKPQTPEEFKTLMSWCDEMRRLHVRTNADTPGDAARAIEMGAEGIGLCRTEHMFFETEQRRLAMQEMIVAETEAERVSALDKLLPYQRDDFKGIFEAMDGKPVTIRLLDPPLHEFLPHSEADMQRLAEATHMDMDSIRKRAAFLHEANPMLGHRGCRLCITYPEILDMQVRAIIEAAIDCRRRGVTVLPEIMIPLTIAAKEMQILADQTRAVADAILAEAGESLPYLVGTMIETPRAALVGDKIAEVADFFSFGTNDLTQMTMGFSRDDVGKFLPDYVDQQKAAIFTDSPFHSLDQEGVGLLVKWCIERGRSSKPKLKIGICGEHGGELESVKFCHNVGMDYVSCSPFRVPIARLAAAQAAMEEKQTAPRPPRKTAPKKKAVKKAAGKKKAAKKKAAAKKTRKKVTKKKTAKHTGKKKVAKKKKVKKAKKTRR